MKPELKKIIILICCALSLLFFCGCKSSETTSKKYDSLESMEGISTGVFTGSVFDDLTLEMIPTANISYYQSAAECVGALLKGKIDLTINEEGAAILAARENPDLTVLPYKVGGYQYGAIFNKDEAGYVLCSDFNRFLRETWSTESLEYLYLSWMADTDGKNIDYQSLPATNGTITVATDSVYFPLTFIKNGNHTGFEVELIYRYCKSRGYALNFEVYDVGGVLSAVSTGKVDIGMSSIIITEERKENYYFSDPYASGSSLFIIRKENAPGEYNNVRELDGKTIGLISGGIYDLTAKANLVDPSIEYQSSVSEIMALVRDGKIDAGMISDISFDEKAAEDYGLCSIGSIATEDIACALSNTPRGNALKTELDEYISDIRKNGELEAYKDKWLNENGSRDVDYEGLENINGTIKLAVSTILGEPICYQSGDKIIGFDIDIIVGFAKSRGYDLEITDYAFRDLLTAVEEGTCDIGISNITVTEDRKARMLFSEPYYDSQVLVFVKKNDNNTETKGFFNSILKKINRTLIEENRYQLYLNGIVTTCIISIGSAIAGLILGFLLFLLFQRNYKISNGFLRVYEWIFNALPIVVVLMIFYYVVFGDSKLSGIWVSVIAFTFIFSFSVFGLLKTCFKSVDIGQYEAAYSLGYSKRETLQSIVIPQVMPVFIPPFKSEFMNLFKATSIVGYIAVQDITKISDIIRSRTYEAFFPIIITTVIYFVITALFGLLTKRIEKKFDRRTRDIDKILKEVK